MMATLISQLKYYRYSSNIFDLDKKCNKEYIGISEIRLIHHGKSYDVTKWRAHMYVLYTVILFSPYLSMAGSDSAKSVS